MRLAVVLLTLSAAHVGLGQKINYFNPPVVTDRISSDPGVLIGEGNAVALSPLSGNVVATNSDGSVIDIKSGAKYVPESVGGAVSCKSGVDFYQIDGTEYLLYAVVDGTSASRIIALESDTLEFAWSTTLQGVVAGTPRVGSDNEHVYVTHNNGDQGMFTVLTISSGGGTLYFYSPAAAAGVGGFAPLGISYNPMPDGNYANGFRNTNDFVSWANMAPGGTIVSGVIPQGATHAFQLPRIGMQAEVQILTDTTWSTNTPPTLSYDGQSMYYAVSAGNRRGNEVRAWPGVSGKNFGAGSAYNGKGDFAMVGPQPPFSSMVLSVDEGMLFYASTANALYGINSGNGNIIWRDESLHGVVKAKPVVSPNGMFVYFITEDGTICSKDVMTGTTLWTMKNGVSPSVTADFAVDAMGMTLYYAEVESGSSTTYYEITLAEFVPPTSEPTQSLPPTIEKTESPTIRITQEPPTAEPTLEFTLEQATASGPTMDIEIIEDGLASGPELTGTPNESSSTSSAFVHGQQAALVGGVIMSLVAIVLF